MVVVTSFLTVTHTIATIVITFDAIVTVAALNAFALSRTAFADVGSHLVVVFGFIAGLSIMSAQVAFIMVVNPDQVVTTLLVVIVLFNIDLLPPIAMSGIIVNTENKII